MAAPHMTGIKSSLALHVVHLDFFFKTFSVLSTVGHIFSFIKHRFPVAIKKRTFTKAQNSSLGETNKPIRFCFDFAFKTCFHDI